MQSFKDPNAVGSIVVALRHADGDAVARLMPVPVIAITLTAWGLCVPKTLSKLMSRWNRLSLRDDRASLFRADHPNLAIQV